MSSIALAALVGAAARLALAGAVIGCLPPSVAAQPVQLASPPPATFDEAARLFRAGRHAAAYGRFVRLANAGDREAARIALVMHRHGAVLFGSMWDASTEELADWSILADLAERADLEARRAGASAALPAAGASGDAQLLDPGTFRSGRRTRRAAP